MLIVVDIDGTVADGTKRFHKAGPEPDRSNRDDYDRWVHIVNTGIENDSVVWNMKEFVNTFSLASYHKVVFLTSREEKLRSITNTWLSKNGFSNYSLVMRPTGCYDDTATLKERAIQFLAEGLPVIVVDDDEPGTLETVCKNHGWTFLKARSGGQK